MQELRTRIWHCLYKLLAGISIDKNCVSLKLQIFVSGLNYAENRVCFYSRSFSFEACKDGAAITSKIVRVDDYQAPPPLRTLFATTSSDTAVLISDRNTLPRNHTNYRNQSRHRSPAPCFAISFTISVFVKLKLVSKSSLR